MPPDGRVVYLLRKARHHGATHLVMTPVHCLARLAALIPPPRFAIAALVGRVRATLPVSRGRGAARAGGESLCDGDIGAGQEEAALSRSFVVRHREHFERRRRNDRG